MALKDLVKIKYIKSVIDDRLVYYYEITDTDSDTDKLESYETMSIFTPSFPLDYKNPWNIYYKIKKWTDINVDYVFNNEIFYTKDQKYLSVKYFSSFYENGLLGIVFTSKSLPDEIYFDLLPNELINEVIKITGTNEVFPQSSIQIMSVYEKYIKDLWNGSSGNNFNDNKDLIFKLNHKDYVDINFDSTGKMNIKLRQTKEINDYNKISDTGVTDFDKSDTNLLDLPKSDTNLTDFGKSIEIKELYYVNSKIERIRGYSFGNIEFVSIMGILSDDVYLYLRGTSLNSGESNLGTIYTSKNWKWLWNKLGTQEKLEVFSSQGYDKNEISKIVNKK